MATPQISIRNPSSTPQNASPAFFSTEIFMIDDPRRGLRWLEQVGPNNIKHLTKLRIFLSAVYHDGRLIADGRITMIQANETDSIPIQFPRWPQSFFSGEPDGPEWYRFFNKLATKATGLRELYIFWDAEPMYNHLGGGHDVDVVRAVGRMKGLERLEIDGYFSKEWPAFLEQKSGMRLWEERPRTGEYLVELKKYQGMVRDLNP